MLSEEQLKPARTASWSTNNENPAHAIVGAWTLARLAHGVRPRISNAIIEVHYWIHGVTARSRVTNVTTVGDIKNKTSGNDFHYCFV